MSRQVSKSQLKREMFAIFRQVETSGNDLIVTHRGKPVLRIIPIRSEAAASELFTGLQGQVIYLEDIDAPSLSEWKSV